MKTLTDLLAEHLDYLRSLGQSPFTIESAGYGVRPFLRWLETVHGVRTVERLRQMHLDGWQKSLAARRTEKGLPLKPRTVNKKIESCRVFLGWLAERGYIAHRLAESLQYVKVPKLLPTSVLEHRQVRRMLARVDTTTPRGWRNRAMLELVYTSGMRAREMVGLNVADIDLEHGTAVVMGKGGKQRVVPIGRTALRVLESYIKGVRSFMVRQPSEPSLFVNRWGNRMDYHAFLAIVHRCAGQAGLDKSVTPHTFRRTCTTELVRGGANLYHVKELLGHESLETLKYYAKLNIDDLKKTHARCHPREREGEPG